MDRSVGVDTAHMWMAYAHLRDAVLRTLTQDVAEETFERICSLEQVLSDIVITLDEAGARHAWRRSVDELRALAVRGAAALWYDNPGGGTWSGDVAGTIARLPDVEEFDATWRASGASSARLAIFEYLDMWPVWPECLSSEPVDFSRYAEVVAAHVAALAQRPDVVVGVRSSGSFLGAIWAAALRAAGETPTFVTVRPLHRTVVRRGGVVALPDAPDIVGLRGHRRAVVVDDLIGAGVSIRLTIEMLSRAEVHEPYAAVYRCASAGTAAAQLQIDESRLLPVRDVHRSWPQASHDRVDLADVRTYFGDLIADWEVIEAQRLEPSHLLRFLAAITGTTTTAASPHIAGIARNQRFVLTLRGPHGDVRVVAKPLGFGYFAAEEVARVAGAPHHPPVFGLVGGYLLYYWADGVSLPFRDRTGTGEVAPGDLEVVGEVAAWTARAPGTMLLPRAGVVSRVHAAVKELRARGAADVPHPEQVLDGLDEEWLHIVSAAPSNGHWHWVRGPDGRLSKYHREIPNVNRRSDPVEDIAAAGVELDLTASEVLCAADVYAALSGDRPSRGRLAFGVLQHVGRGLREFRHCREVLAPRLGRASDYPAPDEFTRREDGLRHAVALANALLDGES